MHEFLLLEQGQTNSYEPIKTNISNSIEKEEI
jgi:hypothetical protein